MAYIALYRNYRPSNFSEVAGQKHIIKTIKNAVINQKISHAYLFSGQRGIGKTTIARILAKAVNCLNPVNGEPCNECANCKAISNNETPDIIEIDAASNNGVDEMRFLLEKVNFLPSSLNKKVYIIDEVHMLSISAFNALLKTLEEPPVHVMFVLATTEPHKIPMTILSRCQRFDFKQLTNKEIVSRLEEICLSEDIDIENDALYAVAEAAEGGMRDAVNILDQVNSYATSTIKLEDIDSVTGRVSNYKLIELLTAFNNHDASTALKIVDELIDMGKEISRLTNNLVQFLRDILLYKNNVNSIEHKNIYDTTEFKDLVTVLDPTLIFFYIDTLMDVVNKLRYSNSSKIYLEVAIMKIISTNKEDLVVKDRMSDIEDKINDGNVVLGSNVSKELEIKVSEVELKINKVVEELTRLNIQEFKDLTIGKLNLLEDVASVSATLPKQVDDKIESLEMQIAGLNVSKNVETTSYDDSALIERIEKLENKPSVDLSKYDNLAIEIEKLQNVPSVDLSKYDSLPLEIENLRNKINDLSNNINNMNNKVEETQPVVTEVIKESNVDNSRIETIEENIDQLMSYIVDFEAQNRGNNKVSNEDLIKYQKDVEELKENYFTLIGKIVNNELGVSHEPAESNIDIAAIKEEIKAEVLENIEIPTVDNSMNDELLNDILVKYETLKAEIEQNSESVNSEFSELKESSISQSNSLEELRGEYSLLNNKINDVNNLIDELTEKVNGLNNTNIDDKVKDIYKYVDDVKEYNLKLSMKFNELQKTITETKATPVVVSKPIVQQPVIKEEVVSAPVVEETSVEEEVNTVVVNSPRKVVEKEQPVLSEVKEVNETEKIFDVRIVEKILHESRKEEMRAEKAILANGWSKLATNANNTTAPIAKLLRDGSLIANGESSLLIVYAMASYCNRLMTPKVHKEAKDILRITFGKEYDFIALPESTWQEKRKEYYSQYGIGIKYPKLSPINNPELKVVVVKEESENKDRAFDKVASIFGYKNVRRED